MKQHDILLLVFFSIFRFCSLCCVVVRWCLPWLGYRGGWGCKASCRVEAVQLLHGSEPFLQCGRKLCEQPM